MPSPVSSDLVDFNTLAVRMLQSTDLLARRLRSRLVEGVEGYRLVDPDNVVCRLLREATRQKIPMAGITDLCFCEYTSHGHCGPLTEDNATVKNDETVQRLVMQRVEEQHKREKAAGDEEIEAWLKAYHEAQRDGGRR